MKNKEFTQYAKDLVHNYICEHWDKTQESIDFDVYITWYCYELGHNKALLTSTLPDGMYYEVTFNSNKNEIYLDAYKKLENKCFELGDK